MKRNLSVVLSITWFVLLFGGFSMPASAAFSGEGAGTFTSPYLITNADQLGEIANDLTGHYKIISDIGSEAAPVTSSIGTDVAPFKGTLKGDKGGGTRPVVTLAINNNAYYQGLIGMLDGGTIENIQTGGWVKGSRYTGGIVGGSKGGTVSNCVNTADITSLSSSHYFIGGVVGGSVSPTAGTIVEDCVNEGKVTGTVIAATKSEGNVGGIISATAHENDLISGCVNRGVVETTGRNTGGVVGYLNKGEVILCVNHGTVNSTNSIAGGVGGIVGANYSRVKKSFNTGSISGAKIVGGICGSVSATAVIENNYNTGTVTATVEQAGGIAYSVSTASVKYNYNIGQVSLSGAGATYSPAIGSTGTNTANNYYLNTLQAGTTPATNKPVALTAEQMKSWESFEGFISGIWDMEHSNGYDYPYPTLTENPHQERLPAAAAPSNLEVSKVNSSYLLTFNGDEHALGYEGSIGYGETVSTLTTTGTEMDLTPYLQFNGDYTILLKAKGDMVNCVDSAYTKLTYQYTGSAVELLDTPAGLNVAYANETYTLSWNNIDGAESYKIEVIDGTQAVTEETVVNTEYTISIGSEFDGTKVYTLKVTALSGEKSSLPAQAIVNTRFGGGNGVDKDEYLIANKRHLANISLEPGSYYLQTADIINVTTPIDGFSGSYDGQNHSINLAIVKEGDNAGLFSTITGSAKIRNMILYGSVSGVARVGALVGSSSATSDSLIEGIVNHAKVTAAGERAGGIIGTVSDLIPQGYTVIKGVKNYGEVISANQYVGGIAGTAKAIQYSANFGSVTGNTVATGYGEVGGIVGRGFGNITGCYNMGNVTVLAATAPGAQAAGIAGSMRSNAIVIENSYNLGTITGPVAVGIGNATNVANCQLRIANCYNAGDLFSSTTQDGKVGLGSFPIYFKSSVATGTHTITNCYYLTYGGAEGYDDGYVNTTGVDLNDLASIALTEGTFTADTSGETYALYQYPQIVGNLQAEPFEFVLLSIENGEQGTVDKTGYRYLKRGSEYVITVKPNNHFKASVFYNTTEVKQDILAEEKYKTPALMANASIVVSYQEVILPLPEKLLGSTPFVPLENPSKEAPLTFAGVTLETPYGIAAAKAPEYYGYNLTEYGMIFSKTNREPSELTDEPSPAVRKLSDGSYGMLFYGVGIEPGTTYFVRPYAIYEKDEVQTTIYGDSVQFTTPE